MLAHVTKVSNHLCPSDVALVANAPDSTRLKILFAQQILQRLRITLAQVTWKLTKWNPPNAKFFVSKEITKKVYNNRMNSIKV